MKRASVVATSFAVIAIAFISATATAQTRDVPRPAVGTSSISGVVVTQGPASRPVRRVLIQLSEIVTGRAAIAAISDDNGGFLFRDLPAGTYTMVASRAPYLSSAYGSKTAGRGSGVPILLTHGQQLKDVTLTMTRGAVISGTVRDQDGNPSMNAELILMVAKTVGPTKRYNPIPASARTDGRGQYRVFGLVPGDYVVRAQPQLRPGDMRQGATTGRTVTYAPSYYPGTSDASTASIITVSAGEERLGIDFPLSLVPTAAISGRLIGPDGQAPKGASLSVEPIGSSTLLIDTLLNIAQTGMVGGQRVSPDGTFTLTGITPGRYRLSARGALSSAGNKTLDNAQLGPVMAMNPGLAGSMGATLWAAEEISVDGRDISSVDLRLQEGLAITGTVVFEAADTTATLPDASRIQLSLLRADREATSAMDSVLSALSGSVPGRVSKDATFAISGVIPGRYRFTAAPPGATGMFGISSSEVVSSDGWVLKSALWKNRDIADGSIDVQTTDDLSGVVVTYTQAVTEISGRILTGGGLPAPGFPIVVFSTKPADWAGASRRVMSAKPASDGTYRVRGLPGGDYYVCALADLDTNDLFDAAFLEQLVPASFKITLTEGEKRKQDLKIGGGE